MFEVFWGSGAEHRVFYEGSGAWPGVGFYALMAVWGPLGGGEGEGGKLKAAVMSHSLVAPRGGWRIFGGLKMDPLAGNFFVLQAF